MEAAGEDYHGMPILEHTTIDLGNQENARIWTELEQYFKLVKGAGAEWLRVAAAAYAVMDDLGYEDMDSFEASLGEPFESWIKRLGCVDVKTDEDGILVFRPKVAEPHERRGGFTMCLPIRTRQHLQVICVKAPDRKSVV